MNSSEALFSCVHLIIHHNNGVQAVWRWVVIHNLRWVVIHNSFKEHLQICLKILKCVALFVCVCVQFLHVT